VTAEPRGGTGRAAAMLPRRSGARLWRRRCNVDTALQRRIAVGWSVCNVDTTLQRGLEPVGECCNEDTALQRGPTAEQIKKAPRVIRFRRRGSRKGYMKMGGYGYILPAQHERNLKVILQFHYKFGDGRDGGSTTTGTAGQGDGRDGGTPLPGLFACAAPGSDAL
jgi:hypothetical protein